MQIIRILPPEAGVSVPMTGYLHEYFPEMPQRGKRPCVLLFPGGAYAYRSPRESDPVSLAFLARGYQVFTVDYTVAGRGGEGRPLDFQPLLDASRAVMAVRENADKWGVYPDQIAVCGFSAGGHAAASVGILWDHPALTSRLDTKGGRNRPDAMILCYPVITTGESAHSGSIENLTGGDDGLKALFSLEKQVTPNAAPAFLWHTVTDQAVPVENALLLAAALQRNGVPMECHFYAGGAHGMSMCNHEVGTPDSHNATWMELCAQWLADRFGFVE